MTQKDQTRKWKVIASVALALFMFAAILAAFTACSTVPAEKPVARSYQTKCYSTDGGDKWVCADGGEMEFQSGSTLDIQSTAVMTINGDLSLDGNISSDTGCLTVTDCLVVTGTTDLQDDVSDSVGIFTINDDVLVGNSLTVTEYLTVVLDSDLRGDVELGDDITDLVRVQSAVRTYDGTDYIQDITVSDVPGTANNGWQIAYNLTDWDGETAFTALMAEAKIVSPTVISGCTAYGADFMVRLEGNSGNILLHEATASTGIGMYAEVQAVYTSSWPTAYAVYGELEAASGSIITDSSVFYADLVGTGTFGTVDVLAVRGDTWDYGIDFASATAMTADFRFQNGTELEEVTDTVLTFSEFLAAEEQTACVVGAGLSITPTGTYQPLTSVAAVTTSLTTAILSGTVNGQLLILVNENASDVIRIDDGANTRLSGDAVLGNDDTLMLIWDGNDWLEIAQADTT